MKTNEQVLEEQVDELQEEIERLNRLLDEAEKAAPDWEWRACVNCGKECLQCAYTTWTCRSCGHKTTPLAKTGNWRSHNI